MSKKAKTQVKGVAVRGKSVRVRPTVSSTSAEVSFPKAPVAGPTLHVEGWDAGYTLRIDEAAPALPEPLNTTILEDIPRVGVECAFLPRQFGLGVNLYWGKYSKTIDISIGPFFIEVYYG